MEALKLPRLDPSKAYVATSLYLPRARVAENAVRGALTFDIEGEARALVKDHPGHLEVPRGFLSVAQVRDELGIEVVDLRPTTWAPLNLRPKTGFTLRPHQVAAWKALSKIEGGVLNMGCGLGKTVMGLYLAAHEKKRLLVVAEQKAHLQNWEEELRAYFDFEGTVGWIGGGEETYGADITFAATKTLVLRAQEGRLPPRFVYEHGLVLYDEAHHDASKWYVKALDLSMGKRIGLTATVKRVDRGEGIFLAHVGPVFYKDLSTDLVPTIEVVRTGIVVPEQELPHIRDRTGEVHVGKMCAWLGRNTERNQVIQKRIDQALLEGRNIYALSRSVEHVKALHALYPGSGLMTGEETEGRLDELHKGQLVFATVQVAKENYNRKDLSTLMVLTPIGAAAHADAPALTQAVGRIQRGCAGKHDAEIVFFLDENVEVAKRVTMQGVNYFIDQGFPTRRTAWTPRTRRP